MTQRSLHWPGASLGDADALTVSAADGIGYRLRNEDYESPFVDRMLRMIFNGTGNRGVLPNWLNELAVAGVATPVTVDTGGAIVYGQPYRNTASVNVAVPTPTNDTRYDYIVLRCDWAAQTIRITRIAGVEGGGVPALTQSPAPDGTGIYDIPLATLEVTTGGVITVTDAREWCTFSTVPRDNSLATAHFANESADFAARATRTKRLFLGGGDIGPGLLTGRFSYTASSYLTTANASTWGAALANEEGWQAVANDTGFLHVFKVPADWVSGDISAYAWWMDDAGVALNFSIRSTYQKWADGGSVVYAGGITSTSQVDTWAVGNVERAAARAITNLAAGDLIVYYVQFDLLAGAEDVLYLGLELEYTGYM